MKAFESPAPISTEIKPGNEPTTAHNAIYSIEREKEQGIPGETSKVAKFFKSKALANLYFQTDNGRHLSNR